MPSLREVQQSFLRAVLHGEIDSMNASIMDDGIPAGERLSIYANNARENFVTTLEAAFPVVRALGGEDWFRQTACTYWRQHPSRAGNLHHIGTHFACYLRGCLTATAYAYFADVAALDWAYQESLVAADHPGFDVAALSHVAPEDYGALHFSLHPSVQLIASSYPILDIWRAHQPDVGQAERIDLASGPQWLVVIRLRDHVQLRPLDQATWTLTCLLSRGSSLAVATEQALAVAPHFDLAGALAQLIRLGVIVDFSTQAES